MEVELEGIQRELEGLHERCEQLLLKPREIQAALATIDSRIAALLPPDSDLLRSWDRHKRSRTDWWHETISGYVDRQDCPNVGYRIAGVRQLLTALQPDFLRAAQRPPTQFYFQAGEVFRARQEVYHLLKRATSIVQVVDPFLDPEVFDFVDAMDANLAWELLTGTRKALFVTQLHALQRSRSNIAARSNQQSHDRFLILDRTEVWHLGTSLNGLGKKAFMINAVEESSERAAILSDFAAWWGTGVAI
jgi:hypothetical protein